MSRPGLLLPDLTAVPVAEIPAAIGELERMKALLYARLTGPVVTAPPANDPERLLTAQDVSRQVNVSARWLYRHADKLPFTRRLGRKVLFSAAGLEKWLRSRRPC